MTVEVPVVHRRVQQPLPAWATVGVVEDREAAEMNPRAGREVEWGRPMPPRRGGWR